MGGGPIADHAHKASNAANPADILVNSLCSECFFYKFSEYACPLLDNTYLNIL